MQKHLFIFLLTFFVVFIPHPVRANDSDLIINEIMYDFPESDDGSNSNPNHNLTQNPKIIPAGGFIILSHTPDIFLSDYFGFPGTIFKVAFSLANDESTLKLCSDSGNNCFQEISYQSSQGANGDGKTLEKDGSTYRPSFILNGTPGKDNSTINDRIMYSHDVFINEILPKPEDGSQNEYIELYNSGDIPIDLTSWQIDDIANGGASPYKIEQGKMIDPNEYLVFYKTQTKLTLNDKGDFARLLWPDGLEACSIPYSKAFEDQVYMRNPDGSWNWSIEATPLKSNILRNSQSLDFASSFDVFKIITIKTGEINSYLNKRVELLGKIVETQGDTFYLDDGSGKAKIYIQKSTNIDKPRMSKNDLVKVIGIVNKYGDSWRVLPKNQDDIVIISTKTKLSKTVSEQNAPKKVETEKILNTISSNTANNEIQKLFEEALNPNNQDNVSKTYTKPLFYIIIISSILLIGLVIQWILYNRRPKNV